jgi:hypothetical protein
MTKEAIQKIFEKGIDLNIFTILLKAKNQEDFLTLLAIRKIEGIVNLMVKRKYLTEDLKITEKGQLLLVDIGWDAQSPQVVEEIVPTPFEQWTEELLAKLKAKLKDIIGKDQIMGFGNVYFIPGIQDLRTFLRRFSKEYNISLISNGLAIETCLLRHVTKCAKAKSFAPAVKYFIIKDKVGSQLAAALENYTPAEERDTIEEKIEVKNLKDLF